jgi:hypothetical protein
MRKEQRHYTTTFVKKMKCGFPRESGSSVGCSFGAAPVGHHVRILIPPFGQPVIYKATSSPRAYTIATSRDIVVAPWGGPV